MKTIRRFHEDYWKFAKRAVEIHNVIMIVNWHQCLLYIEMKTPVVYIVQRDADKNDDINGCTAYYTL